MRRLRAVRRHALPFWRHWNRDMTPGWAVRLGAPVILLALSWLFLGGWWDVCLAALFAVSLVRYTAESLREYRHGRHEIHDGKDTFRW